METFLEIVKENYVIFTIVTIILILALIGYIVDNNVGKDVKIKKKKEANLSAQEDSVPEEDVSL